MDNMQLHLILDFAAANERLQIPLHVHHVRKYTTTREDEGVLLFAPQQTQHESPDKPRFPAS